MPGVTTRRVDAKAATVTVDFDSERASIGDIARVITEAGFPAKARPSGG
ncbi:heavy-metal-associated domain-containing protein [Dokdonella sp.]